MRKIASRGALSEVLKARIFSSVAKCPPGYTTSHHWSQLFCSCLTDLLQDSVCTDSLRCFDSPILLEALLQLCTPSRVKTKTVRSFYGFQQIYGPTQAEECDILLIYWDSWDSVSQCDQQVHGLTTLEIYFPDINVCSSLKVTFKGLYGVISDCQNLKSNTLVEMLFRYYSCSPGTSMKRVHPLVEVRWK
jgi:hypothetical protein